MFDSTKTLLDATAILRRGRLPGKRLVAYRAQATRLARHRVDMVERLFGSNIQCYTGLFFHESIYYMVRKWWLSSIDNYRRLIYLLSLLYGGLVFAGFYFLLFATLGVNPFANSLSAFFSVAIFVILIVLAAWLSRVFIGHFRAELQGIGDRIRSEDLRRYLYLCTIGSCIYYFGFGLAFTWLPWFRDATLGNIADTVFALLFGTIGAFGVSVCFGTWLYVIGINNFNREMASYFLKRFPVEVIVHELVVSACLLRSAKDRKLSFRKQRSWYRRIELVARAVELGLRKQLLLGDHFSSSYAASRLDNIANGFRDLKIWLAMPKPDSYTYLERRLVAAIDDVVAGNWDHLPVSSRPLQKSSLVKDIIVVLFVIALAVGLSGCFAWLTGILFKNTSAFVPSFGAVFPLITSYFFGLAMPELAARRLAPK